MVLIICQHQLMIIDDNGFQMGLLALSERRLL
jgi:hypothetical protein